MIPVGITNAVSVLALRIIATAYGHYFKRTQLAHSSCARDFQVSEEAGAFAGLALGRNGVRVAAMLPLLFAWARSRS